MTMGKRKHDWKEKICFLAGIAVVILILFCVDGMEQKNAALQESDMYPIATMEVEGVPVYYDEYFKYQCSTELLSDEYAITEFRQKYDESGNPVYKDIVIPAEIAGNRVTGIGIDVFSENQEIESVTVQGNNLKWIGWEAFRDCTSLKSIKLPQTVNEISYKAFEGCSSLESVDLPASLKKLHGNVFKDCINLENVTFHSKLKSIAEYAFDNTKWVNEYKKRGELLICNGMLLDGTGVRGEVNLKNINYIAGSAFFDNQQITTLSVKGVDRIGGFAFQKTSVKKVSVSDVDYLGCSAFSQCKKLVSVKLKNIKKAAESPFDKCKKLRYVEMNLQNGAVPEQCFRDCTNLRKVIISSDKKIKWPGEYDSSCRAFQNCNSLQEVYLVTDKFDDSIRSIDRKNLSLYVSKKHLSKYRKIMKCKVYSL